MRYSSAIAAGAMLLAAGACTQTGNVERGAATGAVLGGAAGAIIGNNVGDGDAATGAAIGAAVGGASGAYAGHQKDKQNSSQYQTGPHGEPLKYDSRYNRYYYVDAQTGRTYWANGEFRG